MSRLSTDATRPGSCAHTVWICSVSSSRATTEDFPLRAPICVSGSSPKASVAVDILSAMIHSSSFPIVLSSAIGLNALAAV